MVQRRHHHSARMESVQDTVARLGIEDAYTGWEPREIPAADVAARAARDRESLARLAREGAVFQPLNVLSDGHRQQLLQGSSVQLLFPEQCLQLSANGGERHFLLHGELVADGRNVRAEDCLEPLEWHWGTATAEARRESTVLRVDARELDKLLAWSQAAEYLLLDVSYQRDGQEDAEWLIAVLRSNLFNKVPPTNISQIFGHLEEVVVDAGDAIMRQGEWGDRCYFIKQGEAEVRRSPDGRTPPRRVAEIGPGRCFGEDALVNETVRNASVIMRSNGVLLSMGKRDFLELFHNPRVPTLTSAEMGPDMVLVDPRSEPEYAHNHMDGAVNMPLERLRIQARLLDPERSYVFYCDSGRRARAAAHFMSQRGLKAWALTDEPPWTGPDLTG